MAWQGPGAGGDSAGGTPRDEETRVDLGNLGAPPPLPPIPGATPVIPGGPPPMQPPAPPPPGSGGFGYDAGAPVAWAAPLAAPTGIQVPGAPGLRFGGIFHRFLAWWIDAIIVGIVAGIFAGVAGVAARGTGTTTALITIVIYLGLEFLYFVGFWTSAGRATLGMRIMKLQIGNAFDGRILTVSQAVRRWVGLGLPFQALTVLPGASGAIGSLVGLWYLVLLVSTAMSPTRQGLHDRFANSAIVQPMGASTPAVACLALLILLVAIPLIAIVALILVGSQVSSILSSVGTSVQP